MGTSEEVGKAVREALKHPVRASFLIVLSVLALIVVAHFAIPVLTAWKGSSPNITPVKQGDGSQMQNGDRNQQRYDHNQNLDQNDGTATQLNRN